MKKLHFEILKMLERVRSKHQTMFYSVRKRNPPKGENRVGEGYVFLGAPFYVFVSLCPFSATPNPTSTVGLVFGVDENILTSSWLEVNIPVIGGRNKKANQEDNEVYQALVDAMPANCRREESPNKDNIKVKIYVVEDGSPCEDIIQASEVFLDKWIDDIIIILMSGNHSLAYDGVTMTKRIKAFLKKYEHKDELSRFLFAIMRMLESQCV